VSPQSISRWERGANYPDTESIPHIAVYFKVTTDELLGTEVIAGEEQVKEYEQNIWNLYSSGKIDEELDEARKATKDYPTNLGLLGLLAPNQSVLLILRMVQDQAVPCNKKRTMSNLHCS